MKRKPFSERTIRAAATAIGNARRVRAGLCTLPDLINVMPSIGQAKDAEALIDDAHAALDAAASDIEAEQQEAIRSES